MQKIISSFTGDYAFLSNFYPSSIMTDDGLLYPTVEHAYQAAKTDNMEMKEIISQLPTPGKAKRLGQTLALKEFWDQSRIGVMEGLVTDKFRNLYLMNKLVSTGDVELIEGNKWFDTFWGMVWKDEKWVGDNHLGLILMRIRANEFKRRSYSRTRE